MVVHPKIRSAISELEITKREAQIVEAIVMGNSTSDVAEQLSISPATVRTHLRNIFTNLDVNSRTELIAKVLNRVLASVDAAGNAHWNGGSAPQHYDAVSMQQPVRQGRLNVISHDAMGSS